MKIITAAAILIFATAATAQARWTLEDSCKANCTWRDRKAYYVDQKCVRKCVKDSEKAAEEAKSQRLQDEANQAIIDSNRTYQKNSKDARRYLRANPPQGNK